MSNFKSDKSPFNYLYERREKRRKNPRTFRQASRTQPWLPRGGKRERERRVEIFSDKMDMFQTCVILGLASMCV